MKKILLPFIKAYSWFKRRSFAVRISILFFLIYFGLFYISGFFAERHLWLTNFKWVLNATKNDYGVIEENVLKLIEITISALAFTGLIASILYQREELLVTKDQLKDQSENIQRSINETNRNFEREILRDFSRQLKDEINHSDFALLDSFFKQCNTLIDLAKKDDVTSFHYSLTFSQIKLFCSTLSVPVSLMPELQIISKCINEITDTMNSHQKALRDVMGYDQGDHHDRITGEIKVAIDSLDKSNAVNIFKTKQSHVENIILDITNNFIQTLQQFNESSAEKINSNSPSLKINYNDPVVLMFKSILANSSFLYLSNSNSIKDDFRIDNSVLFNFFYNTNMIQDGQAQQYDTSDEFDIYINYMEECGIIKDKDEFINDLFF